MRICLLILLFSPLCSGAQGMKILFEESGGKRTPTYPEVISWWKILDQRSGYVQMTEMGPTDGGQPLHLVLVSSDKDFDIISARKKKKTIILINNGIHPGEPDGIDASMLLVRDLLKPGSNLPSNVVLAIIPVYNIGGALNRSTFYRVDQNGPEEFGFRGNAQNLDLNRDFIKCDSKEALSFARIFRWLDPDIFVDNHVSNGADYQHVMTLLTTQHNKLGGTMGRYLNETFEPALYRRMKEKGFDLVPYVNHFGETPEKGWTEFWDSPRYSSGYAALWNCFAFVPETHMLKPYAQRVQATLELMKSFIWFATNNSSRILGLRAETRKHQLSLDHFPLAWKNDRTRSAELLFKGYEAGYKTSLVSGLKRLYYDRSKPFEKRIPFFNYYKDTLTVRKPHAYIIPQGWWKVLERLQANGITMRRLTRDTMVSVEWYRIESFTSGQRPFEGHHINSQVRISANTDTLRFLKGDYYIPMNQEGNRFLIETLEPQAEDSYFSWNFFDPILGQKEGFSSYVFEETAAELLQKDALLRQKLESQRKTDSSFAQNANAQLNFVYQNSSYFEPAYRRYPVYRVP
jgi:hypothetical protein